MLEVSRYIAIGQFVNNGSILTRIDPRVKLLCAIALIVLVSFLSSFSAFALCLLFCAALQYTSGLSARYVLSSFRAFLLFLLLVSILEVLFYQSTPPAPQLWHWAFLGISWKGILTTLLGIVRVLFLYYLITMLTFTTSIVDLTDGLDALTAPLQKIGIPTQSFTMVLVIAFKFVPIFLQEIERLSKAQMARGQRSEQGNLLQRTLKLASLLIPLFVSGFKRVSVLTTAMEARCYGISPRRPRTRRRQMHLQRLDIVVLLLTGLLCVAASGLALLSPF